jgi:hypothetical protein
MSGACLSVADTNNDYVNLPEEPKLGIGLLGDRSSIGGR